jgi:hypothetical protein
VKKLLYLLIAIFIVLTSKHTYCLWKWLKRSQGTSETTQKKDNPPQWENKSDEASDEQYEQEEKEQDTLEEKETLKPQGTVIAPVIERQKEEPKLPRQDEAIVLPAQSNIPLVHPAEKMFELIEEKQTDMSMPMEMENELNELVKEQLSQAKGSQSSAIPLPVKKDIPGGNVGTQRRSEVVKKYFQNPSPSITKNKLKNQADTLLEFFAGQKKGFEKKQGLTAGESGKLSNLRERIDRLSDTLSPEMQKIVEQYNQRAKDKADLEKQVSEIQRNAQSRAMQRGLQEQEKYKKFSVAFFKLLVLPIFNEREKKDYIKSFLGVYFPNYKENPKLINELLEIVFKGESANKIKQELLSSAVSIE